jgi:hypothetical protein
MTKRERAPVSTNRRRVDESTSDDSPSADKEARLPMWMTHKTAVITYWVLGGLAAIATVVAVVLQLIPMFTPEEPTDSASGTAHRAASIHVGYQSSAIAEVLGEPIKLQKLDGGAKWVQQTYVKDDAAVSAIVDENGVIQLYSLMVCAPQSNLRIGTFSGTTVTLQGPSIAHAEKVDGDEGDLNDRALVYVDGFTGSSLGHLIEKSVDQTRSGNGYRSYLIGINRACGETDFMDSGEPGGLSFIGGTDEAPDDLRHFRESHPANFYTEVAGDFGVQDDSTISIFGAATVTGGLAAPYIFDLSEEYLAQGR